MLLKHTLFVITGANRGFGEAIAETFAANTKDTRTTIVLVGRDQTQLSKVNCQNEKVSCHIISQANLTGAKEAQTTVIDKLDALLKVTLTYKNL
jgi:sepiapterin reductase